MTSLDPSSAKCDNPAIFVGLTESIKRMRALMNEARGIP